MEIYDVHQHLDLQFDRGKEFLRTDYDNRVRIMDRNGIDKALITARCGYDITHGFDDVRRINDLVAEYVAMHPSRFPIACGVLHTRVRKDLQLQEIHRVIKDLKFKGIVWDHLHYGTYPNDPDMFDCVREIGRLGGVALIHADSESPHEAVWRLEPLAAALPDVSIVVLAGITNWFCGEQTVWIAKRQPNLLLDSVLFPTGLWAEKIVSQVGPERFMFGTDLIAVPEVESFHVAASLNEIKASPTITADQKRLIFEGNFKKCFGL